MVNLRLFQARSFRSATVVLPDASLGRRRGRARRAMPNRWVRVYATSGFSTKASLSKLVILGFAATLTLTHPTFAQNDLPPVSSVRAVALFEAICGKSLPNFKNALRTAKANGVTFEADTGTMFSTKEDLSVKVFNGPGAGTTCSLVFVSKDTRTKFLKAAAQLSPNGELATSRHNSGSKTTGGLFKGKALFFVDGPSRSSGKKYYNLRMLSQR